MLTVKIKNKINIKLGIDYPDYVMKNIEYHFRNNDTSNLDIHNIYYSFKNGPIPCDEYAGYYWIPFYPMYVISKDGVVLDIVNNTCLLFHTSKPPKNNVKNITHGYKSNSKYSIKLHRLLALAFIPYKDNPVKPYTLYVNHINGKPSDNRIENLEWVTPRENLIHAINNGLMPNSVTPIDCKNVSTGETLSFQTVAMAARHFEWSYGRLSKRLLRNNKLYPDMWIFKYQKLDWPNIDKTITRMGVRRKIVSVNTITNEVVHHANIMRAAAYTGVNTTSISWAAKQNTGKPVKDMEFYFLENYDNKTINN